MEKRGKLKLVKLGIGNGRRMLSKEDWEIMKRAYTKVEGEDVVKLADDWVITFVDGNDSKYGRFAYSDKKKLYRFYLTMDEFYGGAVID